MAAHTLLSEVERIRPILEECSPQAEAEHAAMSEAFADTETDGRYSETTKLRCQLAACFGVAACAEAVDLVHEAAGSSAIRLEHGFERRHRDVHVLT